MKYLLAILLAGFIALSFISRQCDHVFTEIEQAAIKIEQPDLPLGGTIYRPYIWPTGTQEGKELICVKCFHRQKQVLDYGQPASGTSFTDWPYRMTATSLDTLLFLKGGSLTWDTSNVVRK